MKFHSFKKSGFTLIELLTAMVIIGLLASVVTISSAKALQKNRDSRRKADINSIASALEKYYYANRVYPGVLGNAYWSTQTPPWIPDLQPYLNVLPVEKGPNVGDSFIGDNPCGYDPVNAPHQGRYNYNYLISPSGQNFILLARFELSGAETLDGACTLGTAKAGWSAYRIDIKGNPIYAIW